MKASVQELPESRARVQVEVEAADVERQVERAAADLGREMKVPGFRKGKVPARVVLQRVGRQALLEEAIREALPGWYERAMLEAGIAPVGDPRLNLEEIPSEGQALTFSIEVAVRPRAELGEYKGLEVGRADPEVPEDAIRAELDRLREGFARLEPVEREAREGDLLLIDYRGTVEGEPFEGSEGRDQLVELGSGTLIDGFDEALSGARAGEEREVRTGFPADHRNPELAGREASFAVTVREVREKRLPELDDEFAAEASEFDTLEELRAEIAAKLREVSERRAEEAFREAAVDGAVAQAKVEVPPEIVASRAEEMIDRFLHRLSHQGIDPETFIRVQPRGREGMVEDVKPDAERNLKREAVLVAVAEAEGIEVSDEEIREALSSGGDGREAEADQLLSRLRETGRDALVREDLRLRRAAEVIVEHAKSIPMDRAQAREKLWTPEKEREEKGSLWTPGDPR